MSMAFSNSRVKPAAPGRLVMPGCRSASRRRTHVPARSATRCSEPCRKRGVTRQRSPVPGLVAKPSLAEPKSLPWAGRCSHHAASDGSHVVSEVPALPKIGRICSPSCVPRTQATVTRALADDSPVAQVGKTWEPPHSPPGSASVLCEEGNEPGGRGGSRSS